MGDSGIRRIAERIAVPAVHQVGVAGTAGGTAKAVAQVREGGRRTSVYTYGLGRDAPTHSLASTPSQGVRPQRSGRSSLGPITGTQYLFSRLLRVLGFLHWDIRAVAKLKPARASQCCGERETGRSETGPYEEDAEGRDSDPPVLRCNRHRAETSGDPADSRPAITPLIVRKSLAFGSVYFFPGSRRPNRPLRRLGGPI